MFWHNSGNESAQSLVAKAAVPATVVGAKMAGIPVADWVQWLTLAYVALMLTNKAWHMGVEFYEFWVLKKRGPDKSDE